MMRHGREQRGFTLVEMVITIVLTSIVVGFIAVFISGPVQGYTDQARRGELVDAADSALQRIGRDIRRALPNSVRITANGPVIALELLNTVDGVRYRAAPPPDDATKQLDFAAADDAFNSIGQFRAVAKPFSSTSHFLSIYNVGIGGADAYELANVITPTGTQIDIVDDAIAGEDNIRLSPAFQFGFASPNQRLFLIDGPVTYLCDTATGTLNRYWAYAINVNQSARDSAGELIGAGASTSTVADNVAGCGFAYTPGVAERAGLLTMSIQVAQAGEVISLLHQVHVDNVP